MVVKTSSGLDARRQTVGLSKTTTKSRSRSKSNVASEKKAKERQAMINAMRKIRNQEGSTNQAREEHEHANNTEKLGYWLAENGKSKNNERHALIKSASAVAVATFVAADALAGIGDISTEASTYNDAVVAPMMKQGQIKLQKSLVKSFVAASDTVGKKKEQLDDVTSGIVSEWTLSYILNHNVDVGNLSSWVKEIDTNKIDVEKLADWQSMLRLSESTSLTLIGTLR